MKLKYLLELFKPKVTRHTSKKSAKAIGDNLPNPDRNKRAKNKLIKVLGSGLYANVIQNDNHPNEVTKISNAIDSLSKDGYFLFLTSIVKNERLQSNPYLPKIYNIKIYKNADSKYYYVLTMEKLFPVRQLNDHEVEAILDRAFHIKGSKKSGNHNQSDPMRILLTSIDSALMAPKEFYLDSVKNQSANSMTNIKDPSLKQALMIIKKFIRDDKAINDIHDGNVMFRRTSVGAQLVITDPLSNND